MPVLQTVLTFVVAPLGLLLLIYLPIAFTGRRRGKRYRLGQPWHYPPQFWSASAADAGLTSPPTPAEGSAGVAPRVGGGGSGSW